MSSKLEQEIAVVVQSSTRIPVANSRTGKSYERVHDAGSLSRQAYRWIGKCKRCGATHKVEGVTRLATPGIHGGSDYVIDDGGGSVLYQAQPNMVSVLCGDHACKLEQVFEGKKQSKHACGARCMSSTGPSCDCRCKGANHGRNC